MRRRDLRHAGATWFANAGVPLHVVSDVLGHGSVETTRAYLHVDDTALQNAAARMNERLREAAMNNEERLNPLTCRVKRFRGYIFGYHTVGLTGFEPATP
ncbi:tyrosine-type recombinase/integrase [Leucobacter sp. USHLN154]|uniref:tyrosine-type recombinase/integrase n=1 Tax=Leucobacter sp. USHLN154 TaxID=3081269 RepID=UPI00301878C5